MRVLSLMFSGALFLLHAHGMMKLHRNGADATESESDTDAWPSWEDAQKYMPDFVNNPAGNFCGEGKLLPKLYLLGAPKCASTSLSEDLLRGAHEGGYDFDAAPKKGSKKEWHFWHKLRINVNNNFTKNRQLWMNELADCPRTPAMLGDFNINNLAAVPLPKELSNESLGFCSCNPNPLISELNEWQSDVPANLFEAYGKDASKVTFVVMLREPLSRMQSAWYHSQYEKFDKYWGYTDCCTKSFGDAIKHIVEGGKDIDGAYPKFGHRLGGEGGVWVSLYGRHLEAYLKHFSADQFMIIPYKQYFEGAKEEICDDLSARLDTKVCKEGAPLHDEMPHPHPPLEEDLSPRLYDIFHKMMAPETQRLVSVLSKMHAKGATLGGYHGRHGAQKEIREWLLQSWQA